MSIGQILALLGAAIAVVLSGIGSSKGVGLSGETAAGEYPADVIRYLALAAHAAETFLKETRL